MPKPFFMQREEGDSGSILGTLLDNDSEYKIVGDMSERIASSGLGQVTRSGTRYSLAVWSSGSSTSTWG